MSQECRVGPFGLLSLLSWPSLLSSRLFGCFEHAIVGGYRALSYSGSSELPTRLLRLISHAVPFRESFRRSRSRCASSPRLRSLLWFPSHDLHQPAAISPDRTTAPPQPSH